MGPAIKRRLHLLCLLFAACSAAAQGPVYVVLWFDTEDYIEPAADDAALRLAQDLTALGVRATFKLVGEKARTLEARGRKDVLRALARHDIGYHSNFHSIPPAPAVYLRELGYLEGAAEFERREAPGSKDLRRIFGLTPSCYGQPGSSWGPQSNPALRRMGIRTYLDEGSHVGVEDQPFWYGGLLYIFHMGRYVLRPSLNDESLLGETLQRFDQAVAELSRRGGGVISSYYHPTEFVTTEFWDGVNFARGASPERSEWRRPRRRTPEDSERAFRVLKAYVEHARKTPGVHFLTARELFPLYEGSSTPSWTGKESRPAMARHMAENITFLVTEQGSFSAAEMLLALLGMPPRFVEGPLARRETSYREESIPRPAFQRAQEDVVSFIRHHQRLPETAWIGSEKLSIGDFAATLAGDDGGAPMVRVRRGNLEMEKYFATDPERAFRWVIHPEGFRAPELLEMARLQGWTLKPARLKWGQR